MAHVIQTDALIQEGVLTPAQGAIIASRSRQVMVALVINAVLCFGIITAAAGFISLLADALAVAIVGGLFLSVGAFILIKGSDVYRMFGTAAALIGAGMLAGGTSIEILDTVSGSGGGIMLMLIGLGSSAVTAIFQRNGLDRIKFLTGSILLMTTAMHLGGLYVWAEAAGFAGLAISTTHFYAAVVIFAIGMFVDLRLMSAVAIVPLAQMLDTGTFYWSATYAFYSPEPTLSILQMSVAMAACLAVAPSLADRYRRHTHMVAIMAFIVANLCFLVGSLFGDVVGDHVWGPGRYSWRSTTDYDTFHAARVAFEASAIKIPDTFYTIIWAVWLVAAAFWASRTNRRGIFNAAMTFGGIHAYTQTFETFYNEPLAYVIGGLAAIPLAWGLWRLNDMFESRSTSPALAA